MNWTEYKKYHESFMQGNDGSTPLHTFCCIFFTVLCSLYCAIKYKNEPKGYCFEYFTIVVTLILAHTTVLSEHIFILNIILICLLLQKLVTHTGSVHSIMRTFQEQNSFSTKHIKSISILRGLTYLMTVLCILAVDFQAFPRYLAKTEQFGFSFMDTGVGLFVLMSGLVHKELSELSYKAIFKSNTKFISILLVLGMVRYVSVKQLDYQEHVTEYGVHWNFFFTLAICKFLSSLLLSSSSQFSAQSSDLNVLYLSVIVLLFHEVLLVIGLKTWVFSDTARTDLLSANREGITSSLGYVSLYLFGIFIKDLLLNKTLLRYRIMKKMLKLSLTLWILLYIVNIVNPTSRTLANAGYCIYLAATLTTVMMFMYTCEIICQNQENILFQVPVILRDVNQNGLLYFLLANLLTGAINLSIQTLFVSKMITLLILNCYMVITTAFAVYLRNKKIKI